jgi:predicted nuclease of predicted toxin-antitoxin system
MKFLLDEGADSRLAAYLTDQGHDVTSIARDYPHRLSDQAILAIANREGRILLINDRDFGELIFRKMLAHKGVIFFRLRTTALAVKRARLAYVLTQYATQLDQFIVVTKGRVRVRATTPR